MREKLKRKEERVHENRVKGEIKKIYMHIEGKSTSR
jgi:hypothetical protein